MNKNYIRKKQLILAIFVSFILLILPATQISSLTIQGDGLGVVHTYGDPEVSGSIGVSRSDATTVTYDYEAKPTCVKFEDGNPQLGEDDTVGLTDTFIITFYGGALPITGEFKAGAGEVYFTINYVGETINIYYYSTLAYNVTLVSLTNDDNTFTFEVESIAKPGNTALSHIEFCFSERIEEPDISIIKEVWNGAEWVKSASFNVGEDVDFRLNVTNNGDIDLENTEVTDDLPTFLAYNYDATPAHSSASDHHIEWDLGTLNVGVTVIITFSAEAESDGEDDNLAEACGEYPMISDSEDSILNKFDEILNRFDTKTRLGEIVKNIINKIIDFFLILFEEKAPVSTDTICDSDTAHVIVTTCPNPNVEIIKKVWNGANWVDSASFFVGDDVQFKLTITNIGNVPLDSYVYINDTLPGFLSFNDDANITPSAVTLYYIEWFDLSPLGVDESIEITFSAHADTTGGGDNLACVEGQYDSETPVSDSDDAHVTVVECPNPNVELIKKVWNGANWVDSASFMVGDDIDFKILISNTGNMDLTLRIDDDLPAFLTYNYDANFTPTLANDHHMEWYDSVVLGVGKSVEITFSAHADSEGEDDNLASVDGYHEQGEPPVSDSDTAHVVVTICPNPDVEIIKKVWNGANWVDSASFFVGDDVQFKIIVTNTGNVPLDNYVYVDDDLPSFLIYNYDANLTPTSASDHHIEWHNLAPLAAGADIEITFSAYAESVGEDDNTACVEAKYDCNPYVDDCDSAHVIVECTPPPDPDVDIIKKVWNGAAWVDSATFQIGDDIQFKIIVKNTGNVPLDNYVYVDDVLPSFLTYNYDANLTPTDASDHYIKWYDIAPLAVDESVEITFSAHADSAGEDDNTACVEAKYDCMPCVHDCDTAHVIVEEGCKDETPPRSWYTITHDPNHYVCRVSTLTIYAEDEGPCSTGEYTIYVYVDGNFYKSATNKKISFQFNEYYGFGTSGTYKIKFWAEDALGNKEAPHIETFIIDNKGPSVSKSFIGYHEYIDYHWHIDSSTQIKLTADDGTNGVGVDYIKYRIGTSSEGGSWILYTGPFNTDKENVYYYARDKLGNTGGLHHLYVTIDDL